MFYVYLIKSKKVNNWVYIGSTGNLRKRIAMHNIGQVRSTKYYSPFRIIYYEAYLSEKDARKREQNLKLRSNAFNQLRKRLIESLES